MDCLKDINIFVYDHYTCLKCSIEAGKANEHLRYGGYVILHIVSHINNYMPKTGWLQWIV